MSPRDTTNDTFLTVVIARQVLRRLRVKLLKQGKTVSWFIRDCIGKFLGEDVQPEKKFTLKAREHLNDSDL